MATSNFKRRVRKHMATGMAYAQAREDLIRIELDRMLEQAADLATFPGLDRIGLGAAAGASVLRIHTTNAAAAGAIAEHYDNIDGSHRICAVAGGDHATVTFDAVTDEHWLAALARLGRRPDGVVGVSAFDQHALAQRHTAGGSGKAVMAWHAHGCGRLRAWVPEQAVGRWVPAGEPADHDEHLKHRDSHVRAWLARAEAPEPIVTLQELARWTFTSPPASVQRLDEMYELLAAAAVGVVADLPVADQLLQIEAFGQVPYTAYRRGGGDPATDCARVPAPLGSVLEKVLTAPAG